MKDIGQLVEAARAKCREGTLETKDYLEIMDEKKTENGYAQRLGVNGQLGIEAGGTFPKSLELIAFFVGRDIVFFREDAVTAKETIEKYAANLALKDQEGLPGSERMILARTQANRLKLEKTEVVGVNKLVLWGQHYNDWIYALYQSGVGFTAYPIDDYR